MNPSVERFTGFAQVYDQVRPSPPEAIADLLLQFAKLETAERVVDLGCGRRFRGNRLRLAPISFAGTGTGLQ